MANEHPVEKAPPRAHRGEEHQQLHHRARRTGYWRGHRQQPLRDQVEQRRHRNRSANQCQDNRQREHEAAYRAV
jgi:hypothetical protein